MKEDITSIWCSYSEQTSELTNKRLTINSLFLAAAAALLGFSIPNLGMTSFIISVVGVLLTTIWIFIIFSFAHLSASKFEVLYNIEEKMSIKPYMEEWKIAKKKKYINITILETIICIILILGFLSIATLSLINLSASI